MGVPCSGMQYFTGVPDELVLPTHFTKRVREGQHPSPRQQSRAFSGRILLESDSQKISDQNDPLHLTFYLSRI